MSDYLEPKDMLYVLEKIEKFGINSLTFADRIVKQKYDVIQMSYPNELRQMLNKEKEKQRAKRLNAGNQVSESDRNFQPGNIVNLLPSNSHARYSPSSHQALSSIYQQDLLALTSWYSVNSRAPSATIGNVLNDLLQLNLNPNLNISSTEQLNMVALQNIGNSCYMNAVLYVMRFTPYFLHDLHHVANNLHLFQDNQFPVISGLHSLFQKWTTLEVSNSKEPLQPHALQTATAVGFEPDHQHDSHEYLMFHLNRLRECSYEFMKLYSKSPELFDKMIIYASILSFDFFRENFVGKRQLTTQCRLCGTECTRSEDSIDLLVTLLPEGKIDDNFIRISCLTEEDLEDYKCTNCGKKVPAKQKTSFPELPRILVVHLGRFDNQLNKVNTDTPTPFLLDCFCNDCNTTANESHQYQLYALITHLGIQPTSGHYIAYVRSFNGSPTTCEDFSECCEIKMNSLPKGYWLRCDDDCITSISPTNFAEKMETHAELTAPYILFYARKDIIVEKRIHY